MKARGNTTSSYRTPVRKRTSIGHSIRTRPKNKHKRRNYKAYRGQGKSR